MNIFYGAPLQVCCLWRPKDTILIFQIASRLKYNSSGVRVDETKQAGADTDGDIGFVNIRARIQLNTISYTIPTTTVTVIITKDMVKTMYAMLPSSYLHIIYFPFFSLIQNLLDSLTRLSLALLQHQLLFFIPVNVPSTQFAVRVV